jgi:hypothetical protein
VPFGAAALQEAGRILRVGLFLAPLALLTACPVVWIEPLADQPKDYVFDPHVLGTWVRSIQNGSQTVTFSRSAEQGNVYRVDLEEVQDDRTEKTQFEAGMVELSWVDGREQRHVVRFLDLWLESLPVTEAAGRHIYPVHSYFKIDTEGDRLILSQPRESSVDQYFCGSQRRWLNCRGGDREPLLVLATSSEARELLTSYGVIAPDFYEEEPMVFVRREPSARPSTKQ